MADKKSKKELMAVFSQRTGPLSLSDIQARMTHQIAERTLRRWLDSAVNDGVLVRTGQKRGTRYELTALPNVSPPEVPLYVQGKSEAEQTRILTQIRDIWTHTSTALEGNTLTLGDTHFVLEEGLTISGKPIKEHQEVIGHAKAIDLIYAAVGQPVTKELVFALHEAVQSERVWDINKPFGAWKVEPNYANTVDTRDNPVHLEYALPSEVPILMAEVIDELNVYQTPLSIDMAPKIYSKLHAGIAHIHPFWDGNGRIARLLANVPLLRSSLPPLIIPKALRREYIQLLATYEIATGQITRDTGVWPNEDVLMPFTEFVSRCYETTLKIWEGRTSG